MSLSKKSINLAWIKIRHEEIGSVLGSCSLEADATYTTHNEQWEHIEFLLKLITLEERLWKDFEKVWKVTKP